MIDARAGRASARRWLAMWVGAVVLCALAMPGTALAQSGDRALIYCGSGGFCDSGQTQLIEELERAGAAGVDIEDNFPDLAAYRLVFVMVPRLALSQDIRRDLVAFEAVGGVLVLVTERESFQGSSTASLNVLLDDLGLSLRLQNDDIGQGCGQRATSVGTHPLVEGVTGFDFANTSRAIGGGTILAQGGGVDLLRVERRTVTSADSNIFSDECLTNDNDPFEADRNRRFFFNLWNFADVDLDNDGVLNADDNCLTTPNGDQANLDNDFLGDACDDDVDGDATRNADDNCPLIPNPGQENTDFFLVRPIPVPFAPRPAPDTVLTLGDDELSEIVPIGFNFLFFDQIVSQARISSNGFITFDLGETDSGAGSRPVPSADGINHIIAGYWQDLDPSEGGEVRVGTAGTAPNREFVVSYDGIAHAPNNDPVTFQIILRESDGRVEIVCDDCPTNGQPHTQGLEDASGRHGGTATGRNQASFALTDDALTFSITRGDDNGDVCDDDDDNDGILDGDDNCQFIPNPGQEDADNDNTGDVCENDRDGDGVIDAIDNCQGLPNPDQINSDDDVLGDACDDDDDNDTVLDDDDNCRIVANLDQADLDRDGLGDLCDNDQDGDTVLNGDDNCPVNANTDQADLDRDGLGDVCDPDIDDDGILNDDDNCPRIENFNQLDGDMDGVGDACEDDLDGDGVVDANDNCPTVPNADQANNDNDAQGDACDPDDDNDIIFDVDDNCPLIPNQQQTDTNGDGIGDVCDNDNDLDGILNDDDNCVDDANEDQADLDGDGRGDECDDDVDGDGSRNGIDNCRFIPNPGQENLDGDIFGDICDDDVDGDGTNNDEDNCLLIENEDQSDIDMDGEGDICDDDIDGDTILNDRDNCPEIPNENQRDLDQDTIGDVCDDDIDGDRVPNDADNCPTVDNFDQGDADADNVGNACDNCPDDANEDQADGDGNGTGDVCEEGAPEPEPEPEEPEVGTIQGGACLGSQVAAPTRSPAPTGLIGLLMLGALAILRRR